MFDDLDPRLLTYAVGFLAAALLVYGLVQLVLSLQRRDHKRVERRMEDNWARATGTKPSVGDVLMDLTHEQKWAMARWLTASRRGMSFRKLCTQAALSWPAHQVLGCIGLCAIAFLAIGIVVGMLPMVLIIGTVLVIALPILSIMYKRNARMRKFNNQMPEALELLSQSLRAGQALPSGIQLVAEQMDDPIGTEFARVHAEQDLGIPLEEALEHLSDRIELLDLKMFVTAIHIQRQTGGNLTEMMDRIAAVIRDRIKILGQVRALTAEGRLSGWILTLMPVGILFLLFQVNPDHPRTLIESDLGIMMIVAAVVMQLLGMFFIRKIVNIKV